MGVGEPRTGYLRTMRQLKKIYNICTIFCNTRRRRKKTVEEILEVIMVENLPKFMTETRT